ncbi:MAG: hypothetical protein JSR34_11955 [Proteobacteria bacterium]|nr:hypothetical protein [Pseudomonadota bacterium]
MNPAERYRAGGASLVPGLLAPEIAQALTRQIALGVAQGGQRWLVPPSIGNKPCYEVSCMQWPVLMSFLWGMTPRVEQIAGVALLPTYSYFRTYQQGDVCRIHADRPACEHSLSLTLAYADGIPWALEVADTPVSEAQRQTVRGDEDFGAEAHSALSMAPGDGVVYRGHDYRHGRTAPNPNRWSAHLFMHWVDRDGPYRGQIFDGKPMLGSVEFHFPI